MNQPSTNTVTRTVVMRPMADIFDVSVPDHIRVPVFEDRTPHVPEIDPFYVFDRQSLKRVMQWLNGAFGRNLLLTGPTGCGKSTLIEQVCARLNIEVYRIGCHGKLEFPELLGSMQLVPGALSTSDSLFGKVSSSIKAMFQGAVDGESMLEWLQRSFSSVVTRFIYGPAVNAARRGAVLLVDEGNFLQPSTIGAFNTMLDSGPISVPDTGEIFMPQPSFRIAFTGNSMDGGEDISLHRGVQRMNIAFMNRFLCMRCDYMPPVREAAMLGKAVNLPGALVQDLITVANDTRSSFKAGAIETTISTRVLKRWAQLIEAQAPLLATNHVELITDTLNFALLDGVAEEDATAIRNLLSKTIEGKSYGGPGAPNAMIPQVIHLHVDPNGGDPKYWGVVVVGDGTENVFWESFGVSPTIQSKPVGYFATNSPKKLKAGYKVVPIPTPVRDPMILVQSLTKDWYKQLLNGSTVQITNSEHRAAMIQLAKNIGHAEWESSIVG